LADKDNEILKLQNEIALKVEELNAEIDRKRHVEIAFTEKMKHIDEQHKLATEMNIADAKREKEKLDEALKLTITQFKLSAQEAKEFYETQLKEKDDEIERFKNLKAKLTTKLVGQTLEEHCEIEFERNLRPHVSRNVTFTKDNETKDGTKGDYIYRETDENGIEILSIMFEMKNEENGGTTKNIKHLPKLDSDRTKKNCEYAVLVSMLEPESELFNIGIVDKSYEYEKMYVIRPQFFIPIISLLRNEATKVSTLKNELAVVRNQSTDITNFEDNLNNFKNAFGNNARLFGKKITEAITCLEAEKERIDEIIRLFRGG